MPTLSWNAATFLANSDITCDAHLNVDNMTVGDSFDLGQALERPIPSGHSLDLASDFFSDPAYMIDGDVCTNPVPLPAFDPDPTFDVTDLNLSALDTYSAALLDQHANQPLASLPSTDLFNASDVETSNLANTSLHLTTQKLLGTRASTPTDFDQPLHSSFSADPRYSKTNTRKSSGVQRRQECLRINSAKYRQRRKRSRQDLENMVNAQAAVMKDQEVRIREQAAVIEELRRLLKERNISGQNSVSPSDGMSSGSRQPQEFDVVAIPDDWLHC
ncbi:hypothetical protein LTR99_011121 [Exophiala xenobiotica]|uniref:BZIP domain-containing protein n=1 Tax=Vermiconidia calcicola TaxID=1690605 RepID=A0AAV9PUQ5_9PEZI|nr:hypothetical protein LTR96_010266 [Exophiala xenobiotica]KAK5527541.1 hypothetical protein LTR25_011105 [Vermiconidia calcicola]KAK5528566.1 hypothetical protein LTR23_010968 [Chaetothyriales sp. CCFEE 6169]KAK5290177.1 hypothetical protein LTR99_011121 [Exophiala xenobiotica]KAK5337729.1 hypothetical protein LTR98_006847 [Exophiala xenobiotica]